MPDSMALGVAQASPALKPIADLASPAGFVAPVLLQMQHGNRSSHSAALANQVLRDPLLLRRLSDRVYELLLEDLRQQQERCAGGRYGRG